MGILDELKKGRKTERQRFETDIFHRLAFILQGVTAGDGIMKKGSKVRIRKDSTYYGQSKEIGELQGDFGRDPEEYLYIIFRDGLKKDYRRKDLELVDAPLGQIQIIKEMKKGLEEHVSEMEKKLISMEARMSEKEKADIPPFHLVSKESAEVAKEAAKYSNPYFRFANTPEELVEAHFLFRMNPSIDENVLSKENLGNVLYGEIAKNLLPKLEQKKKKAEEEIEKLKNKAEDASFKSIASKFKIEGYSKESMAAKKLLESAAQKARARYLISRVGQEAGIEAGEDENLESLTEKIAIKLKGASREEKRYEKVEKARPGDYVKVKDGDGREYEGETVCHCSTKHCIQLNEKKINYSGTLLKRVSGAEGYDPNRMLEALGISKKDFLVTKTLGGLEGLVSSKLGKSIKAFEKEIEGEEGETKIDRITESLIGKKVRLYPGGRRDGREYDKTGDTDAVPAGSEGIVDHIYRDEDKIHVDTLGRGWYVSLRELRLAGNSLAPFIAEKYGLTEDAAEGILKGDCKKVVAEYSKEETKNLEQETKQLGKQADYLRKFISRETPIREESDVVQKSLELKVGDRVIMGPEGSEHYSCTKEGSIGFIEGLEKGEIADVKWEKLTGSRGSPGSVYRVNPSYLRPYGGKK